MQMENRGKGGYRRRLSFSAFCVIALFAGVFSCPRAPMQPDKSINMREYVELQVPYAGAKEPMFPAALEVQPVTMEMKLQTDYHPDRAFEKKFAIEFREGAIAYFERIGMFSTDYFMYSEDVDLCFKVKAIGLKTYYVPTAIITHLGGVSSSQNSVNSFSAVMKLESRWRFFRKTRSFWYSWLYRVAMFFASLIRIGLVALVWPIYVLRGKAGSPKNVIKKWTSRLRWTLGCERWVKNY